MSQVLELEVNIDNGDAAGDGQDDDVTAQNLLHKEKKKIFLQLFIKINVNIWLKRGYFGVFRMILYYFQVFD